MSLYLKNWEYSQKQLSEETLRNNSCENPLLPFSSTLFLFLFFFFFLPVLVLGSSLDSVSNNVIGCHQARERRRGELVKGDSMDSIFYL